MSFFPLFEIPLISHHLKNVGRINAFFNALAGREIKNITFCPPPIHSDIRHEPDF
jgi:hypothetical protein